MDFLPIAVLVLFVLVGGCIAMIADELGRRIGKRRLTLRRLRPKHTARLINFVTGCLVTLLTTALIMIASSDVRQWLTEGRRILQENQRLTARNNEILIGNRELAKQRDQLAGDLKGLRDQTRSLEQKLAAEQGKLASTQNQLTTARQQTGAANSQARAALAHYREIRSKLAPLQAKYQLAVARERVISKDLAARKKQLLFTEASYKKLQLDYQANQQHYTEQIHTYTDQIKQAQTEIQQLNDARDKAQSDVDAARTELNRVNRQLEGIRNELQTANSIASSQLMTRRQQLIYAVGDEVARVSVQPGLSKNDARAAVNRALDMARSMAKANGAGVDQQMMYVGLPQGPNGPTSEAQVDMLASRLAGADEQHVLIVQALWNAFKGEPVLVKVVDERNPVVYAAGQTIAEVRVDGREDIDKFLSELNSLGVAVNKRAEADKMIPSQDGFGSVKSDQILAIYQQVKSENRPVRLRAIAKQQLRAADPLLLNFVLR